MQYKTNKIVGNEHIFITIKLADECKNGHQDFSITASIYEAGKPKIDKYYIGGGCCHTDILKAFPEFKQFVDLHLSDCNGCPTYVVENGFYHLKNGFSSVKIDDPNFKNEFCSCYRISDSDFDILKNSENEIEFAIGLEELGILEKWKEQANTAIKELEKLTGEKFINTSIKTQYHAPSEEQKADFLRKKAEGYYTEENKERRKREKAEAEKRKAIKEIKDKCKAAVKELILEAQIKYLLLVNGFRTDNILYYKHSKKISFNWREHEERYTEKEYEKAVEMLKNSRLPKNITYEFKK